MIRTVLGRVVCARPSRLARLTAIGAGGICLCLTLTASGWAGAKASERVARDQPASSPARSPLSVRDLSVRKLHGRIVETATIVNDGPTSIRSTTGSLGLSRGPGRMIVGVLTFSVPQLSPRGSRTVRLSTRLIRRLPVPSGTYQVVTCTDIYSQVQRYARSRSCAPGPRLTVSTGSLTKRAGPVPNTTIGATAASAARGSAASFGFVSSLPASTFQCSLDGGPWLACTSPQAYRALVAGAHTFAVRSISPSGVADPSPARTAWIVSSLPPLLTPTGSTPESATGNTQTAAAAGDAGGAAGADAQTAGSAPADSDGGTSDGGTTDGGTTPAPVEDDFNRADGDLGAGWTPMSDGGLSIASDQVVGTAGQLAGDVRTGESYGSDQYSQIELTSTQLGAGQWVGPTVRSQDGGQDLYLGIYFWNYGDPQLRLYIRTNGNWTQLGNSYESGPLPAGTQLTLTAVGSSISFAENGTTRLSAVDSTFTGGAPGIMTYDVATADNWTGGEPPAYSVGGAVSGLSGTLVLQDNGGDDLTVTGDGPFTFATPVGSGGTYDVTVETNPSGQACSVSGGTGTVASSNVTSVAVTCGAVASSPVEDDFNRADGDLGAGWTPMSDGGLSIASDQVVGTAGQLAGDVRTGESYGSDQYSQIELISTQLSGGQWVGSVVRSQNGGQDLYLGIYFWNYGDQQLRLYKRSDGNWIQLGGNYESGPLPAGTQLTLSAVGSTISFVENGTERISAVDSSLTGGAPGIMTYDVATADNWTGGEATTTPPPPPTQIVYRSTDANGVAYYDVNSPDDGYGTQTLRVLAPTHPAPGVPHNFLYVLPVEPGLGSSFGDGLETLASLDAEDQYNLTIIEPTFAIDPWYADNPNDSNLQYETFMTKDLVPWVTQNLSVPPGPFGSLAGGEQNWLIGFSKSGFGAEDLILKHPDLFSLAASWDFPADASSYDQFGSSSADDYGTDANFQANYRLTQSFVDAHKTPFENENRIWIGGYADFANDVSDYDALLTSEGVEHTTETPTPMAHRWDSGWVQLALSALSQDSAALAASP